ncbi:MAG: SDR family oxidoreductase [Rubrobacteraceae bacterium]|nr:SDR family oxidoreductase [Rubrobacteraceae bacterium]
MSELEGKVAIVTGGGRGIGRAISEAYLAEGARVVVTAAREGREIEELASRAGGRALALLADVTVINECERVVSETVELFGRLDVLVNNAGRGMKYVSESFFSEPTRFWETDPEVWRMVIDTNVNGPFFMTRAAVPRMIPAGGGSIINVSMNYETMKRRGFSPYGPSKAALESESIIWSQDLEGTGVRLNVLLPGGATETGMIPAGVPEDARSQLLSPEVVAGPAVYLASDRSGHLNGYRLAATEWSPEVPDGRPVADGLGV